MYMSVYIHVTADRNERNIINIIHHILAMFN